MSKRFSGVQLCLLGGWLTLLVLVMARGSFTLPYISDDFEHGEIVAQIRAGIRPWSDLIVVPFHGQTDVLIRLLFWCGTLRGGMDLTWVRVAICVVHAAGAAGCALLCARWTGSKAAGLAAGTLYAGALGYISEVIYWPSSAIFCVGVTFLVLALVALDSDKLWLCVLMLVIAALGLNGILAAALGLPISYWLLHGKRPPVALLSAMALLLAAGFWRVGVSMRGLGLGAWLVFTAPLRFFSSWTTAPLPGFQTIWKLAPLGWLALIASAWFLKSQHRRVLLAVWTPAVLLALLVGMARADYPFRFGPGSLYTADRYYYIFLLPLIVQCVLSLASIRWPGYAASALVALLGAALIASHYRYLANIPRSNVEAIHRALEQGRRLVQTIVTFPVRPLLLTDARIPMDGAHLNAMTLSFAIYSEYPRGITGVQLVKQPLNAEQAAVEQRLLNGWSERASSRIDFKSASYEQNLDSGFSWWEPPFRWMAGRGTLHLIAAPGDLVVTALAPVDRIHRPIHISVAMNGRPVGTFTIATAGIHDYRLQPPALAPGTAVNITLTSDFVWHARDLFPQSLDERDFSIALYAIGFAVRPSSDVPR